MSLKDSLKKVTDYKYELPKQGSMRVPAQFFISDKLLKLVEEEAIKQAANVATLPGIEKAVMVMSDVHTGYGFPIGGVAAFDYEKGIITPGGIGFDINCLAGNTKVLTANGFWKFLKDLKLGEIVVGKDLKTGGLINSEIGAIITKKDWVYKLKTSLGLEIRASGDHPVLTLNGFKLVRDLTPGDMVITHHFSGVEFEPVEKFEILSVNDFPEQSAEKLNAKGLLPLTSDNPKLGIILKLAGFLTGDGCLYYSKNRGFITVYGSKSVLENIAGDFKALGFNPKIYSRFRKHSIKTLYRVVSFERLEHALRVNSKPLTMLFERLGVPIGNKARQDFDVPNFLFKLPKWLKRLYLAAFFAAEMNKPLEFNKCFTSLVVSANKSGFKQDKPLKTVKFLESIKKLLKEFNITSTISKPVLNYINKKAVKSYRYRLLISTKEENLERFFSTISFEYDDEKKAIASYASGYLKLKKLNRRLRQDLTSMIIALKDQGVSSRAVKSWIGLVANERFIERALYKGKIHRRVNKAFPSFKSFCNLKALGQGFLLDTVEEINLEGFETVYDITLMDENHNFIANNLVVSNCGVRLLTTPLTTTQVRPKIKQLLEALFNNIPSGVGRGGSLKLSDSQLDEVLIKGAEWAVSNGYGFKRDLKRIESYGNLSIANSEFVSVKAKARGRSQLGTLGAGNHFLEIQLVDKIFDVETAKAFNLEKGNVVVMIHTGSRGLGHQVCSDYLRLMYEKLPDIREKLVDKELIYAPLSHDLAVKYIKAMSAAANFAWANRQIIAHQVRKSFKQVLNLEEQELMQLYDVAHNIAKIENHKIDGNLKKLIVHRKGATRAFPPGHEELVEAFKQVGQPVLIPGSMGTASYVLVGTKKAMSESFGSTCHGAGRVMSRKRALKQFRGEKVKAELEKQRIFVKAASWKGISEEAPAVYKDVDEVVRVVHQAGIAKIVARLKPLGVVKG